MRLRVLGVVLVAAAGSCGGGDSFEYTGTPGTPVPIDFTSEVPSVAFDLGGMSYDFIVDTGAPFTILNRPDFPQYETGLHLADFSVFGLDIPAYEVISVTVFSSDSRVNGLLGGDFVRHFALSLDYKGEQGWLSDPFDPLAPIPGLDAAPDEVMDFDLRGGGRSYVPCDTPFSCGTLHVNATRIIMSALFEGETEPRYVLVDTGASAVVLDDSILSILDVASPGRPRLDGVGVDTVDGLQIAFLSRLWRMTLFGGDGAVTEDDVPILVIPDDNLLAGLSIEVGRPIDALVGGTFLRYGLTTIDYPERKVHFARYNDPSHVSPDEYVSVGFSLIPAGIQWQIAEVYPGHDAAAQGIMAGDLLADIAMTPVEGLSDDEVYTMLGAYQLGQSVPLGILKQGDSMVTQTQVLVEDLLPSYPPPP